MNGSLLKPHSVRRREQGGSMTAMETADVQRLARLSRIALSDEEAAALATEFDPILEYVAQVREVSGETSAEPETGPHANVFRDDVETVAPEQYSETLLAAAPHREGRHIAVKKIFADRA